MRPNQKFVSKDKNNLAYLIVAICYKTGVVVLTDLRGKRFCRPFTRSIDSVMADIRSGAFELCDHVFPKHLRKSDSALSHQWQDKRDHAYQAIRPLVECEATLYQFLFGDSAGIFARLVDQSRVPGHKEKKRSKKYIATSINRFFALGAIKNALLPFYYNCGTNPTIQPDIQYTDRKDISLKSKRGPQTQYGEPYGGITAKHKKQIKQFAKTIPNGHKVVFQDIYYDYLLKYNFSRYRRVDKTTGEVFEGGGLESKQKLISPSTFKYHLKKEVSGLEFIRKEKGQINYDKDHKGKPSVAWKDLRGAAQRYEVDATIADLYIRYPHSKDKNLAIGRPIIYIVIDTMTGMIVGVHVCFHGPDLKGARQALFNAMSDKVEFCKKFGLDITHAQWPCNVPPSEFNVDRGGEHSEKTFADMLKVLLGITCASFNAYHRGDAKGTVEKSFDVLQANILEFHAGQVVKNPSKEAQHASRKALYTYEQFMRLLIKEILFQNNVRLKICHHNAEMVRDDIGLTPRDAWNWHLENSVIKQPVDKKLLRFALLPEEPAVVMDKGVLFRGLIYINEQIIKEQWLDKAKNAGRWDIQVRYSDLSTSHIWLADEETQEIMQLDLADGYRALANQLWASELHRQVLENHKIARHKDTVVEKRVQSKHYRQQVNAEAKAETKALMPSESKGIEPGMKPRQQQVAEDQLQQQLVETLQDLSPQQTPLQADTQPRSTQDLSDPTIPPHEDSSC